jgi:hypothetical protein
MVTIASVRAHGVRRFKLTCERHLAASTTAVLREAGPLVFAATRRAQHAEDVHSHWQLFRERLSRQSQYNLAISLQNYAAASPISTARKPRSIS